MFCNFDVLLFSTFLSVDALLFSTFCSSRCFVFSTFCYSTFCYFRLLEAVDVLYFQCFVIRRFVNLVVLYQSTFCILVVLFFWRLLAVNVLYFRCFVIQRFVFSTFSYSKFCYFLTFCSIRRFVIQSFDNRHFVPTPITNLWLKTDNPISIIITVSNWHHLIKHSQIVDIFFLR